jgi:hypothetical protein
MAETRATEERQQADAAWSDARKQATEDADKLAKKAEELATAREELRRCQEQAERPQTDAAAEPSFVPLGGVVARSAGLQTNIYVVEFVGGKVTRYLVTSSDGRLEWVPEAEVSEIGRE